MKNDNSFDILLVEDNLNDAEMTLRALKKNSLANSILHVEDGEEALDYMAARGKYAGRDITHLPKVILLDLKLPKVDGIEVLREIKSNEATRKIPVVVLTSSREERDIVETYSLGVNSYIVKPVEFTKFIESINALGLYWLIINESPV